jgi:hypothetical protein
LAPNAQRRLTAQPAFSNLQRDEFIFTCLKTSFGSIVRSYIGKHFCSVNELLQFVQGNYSKLPAFASNGFDVYQ